MAESASSSASVGRREAVGNTTPWRAPSSTLVASNARKPTTAISACSPSTAASTTAGRGSPHVVYASQYATQVQVVMGLPALIPHCEAVVYDAPVMQTVELYGDTSCHASIRQALEARYHQTNQLDRIPEMTLRIDTELEALRRQCFAERNAQWAFQTPDMFEYVPAVTPVWDTWMELYGSAKKADDKDAHKNPSVGTTLKKIKNKNAVTSSWYTHSSLSSAFVRDPPWPPKEFVVKQNIKPSRLRAKQKKALITTPEVQEPSKAARNCCICGTQESALWRKRPRPVEKTKGDDKTLVKTEAPQGQEPISVQPHVEDDLCLPCYLKTERKVVFDRKQAEQRARLRAIEEAKLAAKKQEAAVKRAQEAAIRRQLRELDAELKRKEKKERKKDKKKKKKRRNSHLEDEHYDEHNAHVVKPEPPAQEELVMARSPSISPMPSPPQMTDGYVYADTHHDALPSHMQDDDLVKEDEEAPEPSAKKQRKSSKSSASSSSKSSKKRKTSSESSSTVPAEETIALAVDTKKISSSSLSRPKATPTRKRARTKKQETDRERELRALGQYCPVCNRVYEEDDASTFVCCDSCEMWVHGDCDPELTAETIAALSNSNEKYICPLCGGR